MRSKPTRWAGPARLRSRSLEMVRQEIWALMTHYAIRHLMHEAADDAEVELDRVSFMRNLRVIALPGHRPGGFSPSPIDELDSDGLG
jgi:hypothetical protein